MSSKRPKLLVRTATTIGQARKGLFKLWALPLVLILVSIVSIWSSPTAQALTDDSVDVEFLNSATARISADGKIFILRDTLSTDNNTGDQTLYLFRARGGELERNGGCKIELTVLVRGPGDINADLNYEALNDAGSRCESGGTGNSIAAVYEDVAGSDKFSGVNNLDADYMYGSPDGEDTILGAYDEWGEFEYVTTDDNRRLYVESTVGDGCRDLMIVLGGQAALVSVSPVQNPGYAEFTPGPEFAKYYEDSICYINTADPVFSDIAPFDDQAASLKFRSDENRGGAAEQNESCEERLDLGGAFEWVICGFLRLAESSIEKLDEAINSMLRIDGHEVGYTHSESNTDNSIYQVWKSMRNLARIGFLIAGLTLIIGSMLKFEIFASYRWNKTLFPAFLAVIMVELSWGFSIFLIDLVNDIADGIKGLFVQAVGGEQNLSLSRLDISGRNLGIATGGLFIYLAGGAFGVFPIIGIALGAILALLIGFIILGLREILIIALLISSPLAALFYALPQTQSMAKTWWSWFTKALMVYPLFVFIVCTGKLVSYLVTENVSRATEQGAADAGDTPVLLAGLLAYFAGPFLLPLTVRLLGGLLQTLTGVINDRSKGMIDNKRKIEAENNIRHRAALRGGARFSDRNMIARRANDLSGLIGAGPIGWWKSVRNGPAGANGVMEFNRVRAAEMRGDNERMKLFAPNDKVQYLIGIHGSRGKAGAWLKQEVDAGRIDGASEKIWRHNLGVADYIGWDRATSRKAMEFLTQSGYNIPAYEEGYNEMSAAARRIAGPGSGEYNNLMNLWQYNLSKVGRFDLAGINDGDKYDFYGGFGRFDAYTIGHGKGDAFKGAQMWIRDQQREYRLQAPGSAQRRRIAMQLHEFLMRVDMSRQGAAVGSAEKINDLIYGQNKGLPDPSVISLQAEVARMFRDLGISGEEEARMRERVYGSMRNNYNPFEDQNSWDGGAPGGDRR